MLCGSILTGAVVSRQSWPQIKAFDQNFTFAVRSKMFLRFPIESLHGKELYVVECASPFAEDKRAGLYAYSRDFECRVSLPGAALLPDIQLLAFNSRIDKEWQSRGGFWWSELTSACAGYPDWGAKRVYRFRGMRLTIDIFDVRMKEASHPSEHQPDYELQSIKVRISGSADLGATNAFGGESRFREPPRQCRPPIRLS